jgi:hypothetical protein
MHILETLLREDVDLDERNDDKIPPLSLRRYIIDVRRHSLDRDVKERSGMRTNVDLPGALTVGMNVKKVHEVAHFANYVNELAEDISSQDRQQITHIVDFGSGRNYLGRTLAAKPLNKHVIGVDCKRHVVEISKAMDTLARIRAKEVVMRNKKEYRRALAEEAKMGKEKEVRNRLNDRKISQNGYQIPDSEFDVHETLKATLKRSTDETGSLQHVFHKINSGDLTAVIDQLAPSAQDQQSSAPNLMVVSLHSCGNLLHHGLRTLPMNPSVRAVALVGCCYNLITERLGPPSFKHPSLRSNSRVLRASSACDPHGFPLSKRFESFRPGGKDAESGQTGVWLNITARMMAVQAPSNWEREECTNFFRRHFYRALLQRLFLDKGVISPQSNSGSLDIADGTREDEAEDAKESASAQSYIGHLTIGPLPKRSNESFATYSRDAIAKLLRNSEDCAEPTEPALPHLVREKLKTVQQLTDKEFYAYEARLWSLMAFSAQVVEAMILVDRWLFLCEMEDVGPDRAWVEAVWDYKKSPRNMVVVGVRK